MLTRLAQPWSARLARPGDSIYLRVASALLVGGEVVIPAGSFLEATVNSVPDRPSANRLELRLRFRRLLNAQGDIADVFAIDDVPNDSAYRRGVTAIADVPGRDQVVTTGSTIVLVVEGALTVDPRRSLARAFGRAVRVVGSPPRLECLVQSVVPTPDVIIPGGDAGHRRIRDACSQ